MNLQIQKASRCDQEAFRSEICSKLSLPIQDMDVLFASGKNSIWPTENSQQGVVLRLLAISYGEWVGLDTLGRKSCSRAVHSVIDGLRKRGWAIENRYGKRIEVFGIKCRMSFYRLSFEGGAECQKKAS